ncbi:hypothetical protein N9J26_01475 [bacterium]|nr:hypothetical protein [bacterium]
MFMFTELKGVVMMLPTAFILLIVLPYIIVKWKNHKTGVVDTRLGIEAILHFFVLIGWVMLMIIPIQLAYLCITSYMSSHFFGDVLNYALLSLLAIFIISLHKILLGKTNYDPDSSLTSIYRVIYLFVMSAICLVLFSYVSTLVGLPISGLDMMVPIGVTVFYSLVWFAMFRRTFRFA